MTKMRYGCVILGQTLGHSYGLQVLPSPHLYEINLFPHFAAFRYLMQSLSLPPIWSL